jgi:hypothetical protein
MREKRRHFSENEQNSEQTGRISPGSVKMVIFPLAEPMNKAQVLRFQQVKESAP